MHLGGYCSPKGRLLATLLIWKSNDGVMLVMPRELLPGIQKRLQMFVLRSKVTIADVSEQIVLIGAAAPDAQDIGFSDALGLNAVWPSAAGLQRALWMGPVESAMRLWKTLSEKLSPMNASHWRWLDIRAGLPMVVEATREQFVPQMVNFDLIGGVNFRKGCYPGQEIVARSQYLGKLKRRMLLASTQTDIAAAGMEIFSEADPGQPCGLVVNAENNPAGAWDLLVEIKLDAAQTPVHLAAANGALLQFSEMPYVIRDPE
jgi:folate-binding protein YgfZ